MGSLSAPVSAVMLNDPAVVGSRCSVSVHGPPVLPCFPRVCCGFSSSLSAWRVAGMSRGRQGVGVWEVLELPWPGMPCNRARRSRAGSP